jgi:rhodanese-related sulfurtransferase
MRTLLRRACLPLALAALLPSAARGQGIDAPRISQADFKKLIAAKNVVIVDTRVAEVFSAGHIPGALLLPLEGAMTWPEEYEKTVATLIASKKPVVTYCA